MIIFQFFDWFFTYLDLYIVSFRLKYYSWYFIDCFSRSGFFACLSFIYYYLPQRFSSLFILYTGRQIITYIIVMLFLNKEKINHCYDNFCLVYFFLLAVMFFEAKLLHFNLSVVLFWCMYGGLICCDKFWVWFSIIIQVWKKFRQYTMKLSHIINNICIRVYITICFWEEVFERDLW